MNSYRTKKEDSDQSDQEELTFEAGEDDYEPKQKRATIWSDVQVERQLNFHGSKINLDKGNPEKRMQRVFRGAETYDLPLEETVPKTNVEIPIVTVTPVSDGPFGEYVDLSTVEEFGVGPSSEIRGKPHFRSRGRGRGRGRRNGPAGSQVASNNDMDTSNGVKEPQQSDEADKTSSNSSVRGRGRGRYGQNQRGFRGRGGYFPGQKRSYEMNTKALVSEDYSLETLMSAEFQHGISLEQLGQEMAQCMGEKDPKTVLKIVEAIGEEKALQLLEETREIESKGGMKTQDGSRRRTPGGVFISLFKSDADVSTDIKDKIFEESRAQLRNFKKAKRRNFETKMQEVAQLIKTKREEESELKPLSVREDVVITDGASSTENGTAVEDTVTMEP